MITRRSRTGFIGIAAALALAACGGSVESTSGAGGGSSSSGGTSVGGGAGSNGSVGSTGSAGTAASTGSMGTGGGSPCGGFGGLACAADEFCDYFDDICGAADGSGICVKRPMGCPKNLEPTCACDGMVYGNPCEANAAGQDASNNGNCPAPMGMFPCGAHFCLAGMQYCRHTPSDVGNEPDANTCEPLPAGCGPMPSCACLAKEPCANMCMPSPGGGITITCPGG